MPLVPIILSVGAVAVVLLLVWGPVRAGLAKQDLESRCDALRAQLALLQTQGQDLGTRLVVQSQLEDCLRAMAAAGLDVDTLAEQLRQIEGLRQRIRQEFTHYRSTDWTDGIKRGNTFGAIVRMGAELAQVYDAALATVMDGPKPKRIPDLERLLKSVNVDLRDGNARRFCHLKGGSGCGINIGAVHAEDDRVLNPLYHVRGRIRSALRTEGFEPGAFARVSAPGAGVEDVEPGVGEVVGAAA